MTDKTREVRIATLNYAAEMRKCGARERTERALKRLLTRDEPLSFANVAHEAGVSISYLYKYPELKTQLQQLRAQQRKRSVKTLKTPPPSDRSKDKVIAQLRLRLKQLEAKVGEQRRHITVLSGQLYDLTAEKPATPASPPPPSKLEPRIRNRLTALGIRLTASITSKIAQYRCEQVLEAAAVVEEAARAGNVRSKARFFIKALEEAWERSDESSVKSGENAEFAEWFTAARAKGLVRASRGTPDGIVVLTTAGNWLPYNSLRNKSGWTLQDFDS